MRDRYDLVALAAFTRKMIMDHPSFEGVDLTQSSLTEEWHIERVDPPSRMRSGDWVIWDAEQGDEQFDLYFMFDERNGRSVTIRARRLARNQFELVSLAIGAWVELTNREAARHRDKSALVPTEVESRTRHLAFAALLAHG